MEVTMRLLKSLTAISFIIFFFAVSAEAQERFQAGGHFMLGYPQGGFKENVEHPGLGGNFYFAYHLPRTILSTGVTFGFLIYGHETRVEPLSSSIPDLIVDVNTTNSILLCHLFLRLQPQQGMFRPYLDGLMGLEFLTTDTSIHGHHNWEDELSSNNYNDLAFSYGAGGGTMVSFLQIRRGESGRHIFSMDLDIGVRYLKGGEAEYLKKGSIHRESGVVIYDVYRSKTDLVKACIGISCSF